MANIDWLFFPICLSSRSGPSTATTKQISIHFWGTIMRNTLFRRTILATSLSLLSTLAGNAIAEGSCPDGFKETEVYGSVSTQTISETQQVGSIELELVRYENDKTLFNMQGAIIGTIVGKNDYEQILLDHTIVFEDGSTIQTSGDTATPQGFVTQCDMAVEELISNFWGTGVFKRASGNIVANGTIGVCPPPGNTNSFSLSGTVCLAPGHKQR